MLKPLIFLLSVIVLTASVCNTPVAERSKENPDYFIAVEEMPLPIGGIEAIQENVIYPTNAKNNSIQGRVYVKAFIDEHGKVVKTEVLKGLGYGLDESACSAIMKTRFKAGIHDGMAVKVQIIIPIVFKLN
jgi:protein TonB